jgi:hypothetical protein
LNYEIAICLVIATLLLILAQVARATRWALLFPSGYLVTRFNLLLALTAGYAINAAIPFKVGEIFRILFVSVREKVSVSFVTATVVAERLSDLLVVSLIAISLSMLDLKMSNLLWHIGTVMLLFAIVIIFSALLIYRNSRFRKMIWAIASMFNEKIKFAIVEFCWSYSELIRHEVLRPNFVIATLIMWTLYCGSFFIFGYAANIGFEHTFILLAGNPWESLLDSTADIPKQTAIQLITFAAVPILVFAIYGILRQWSPIIHDFSVYWKYGDLKYGDGISSVRERFKKEKEYEYFIACLFKGDDHTLSAFRSQAIGNGVVHRLFNGGSEAVIALIEEEENLIIRKYAIDSAAKKLKFQAEWIKNYNKSGLPIVEIIDEMQDADFYRYDMPYTVPSNDFYEVIHTSPIENGISILNSAFARSQLFCKTHQRDIADEGLIKDYLKEKVVKNINFIFEDIKKLLPNDEYFINGKPYHLAEWNCFRDINWLFRQIKDHRTSVIHGDITVENIIVAPGLQEGFYFIDPNPDNIFNSPLIDCSKLMQSFHLGYESLNQGSECSFSNANIEFKNIRSHAYLTLHNTLEQLIINSNNPDTLREVYFHELINYLRLTRYKFLQSPNKGIKFFACTSILIKRYKERAL